MAYSADAIARLTERLRSYGKDVYAKKGLAYQHFEVDGQVVIAGEHVERSEARKAWIHALPLEGKSVIDLGCNLGLFTLEAARRGARRARGVDVQASVIEAASCIRDFFGLQSAEFQVVDLGSAEGRAGVEPHDVVLAFAVYDHLTGRHRQVPPWERENAYLEVTEWLAGLCTESMIVEFHNHQTRWAPWFERLLREHGFAIDRASVTPVERPVFFCRRERPSGELEVDGQRFHRVSAWSKRRRRLYRLERDGKPFFAKRYATADLEEGRSPGHEAELLREFASCPGVVQPVCWDERRIVSPWVDGRPLEVIDAQPTPRADLSSSAVRFRVASAVANVLSHYYENRDAILERHAARVPERYRDEVVSDVRLLADLCPSNVLVAGDGRVAFVDFEPSKPPLKRRLVDELAALCRGASLGPRKREWLRLPGRSRAPGLS